MTNEKAIDLLDNLIGMVEDNQESDYDTALKMAIQALSQEPCDDAVSRQAVLEMAYDMSEIDGEHFTEPHMIVDVEDIQKLPSVTYKSGKWIPVSEKLPEDLEPVNITWVNHEPEPYYHDIKDKNFVATGIYYRGQWYWYSTTCADYLGEYGSNEVDKVDDAVEIVAWMPLPEPYEPQEVRKNKG